MRLITHNMLQCHVKNCSAPQNYPLKLKEVELDQQEAEFNAQFLVNMLPRLDWPALYSTAMSVRRFR